MADPCRSSSPAKVKAWRSLRKLLREEKRFPIGIVLREVIVDDIAGEMCESCKT
ncbi:MAG: hypothetical protein JW743_00445 [Deltaproteobacteria bacterium]|nr:hypothetical protein [Deltaproteobacteria bacterium]MBN2846648.1 hypothetical protein [Deltaproteobacteria bacterium]